MIHQHELRRFQRDVARHRVDRDGNRTETEAAKHCFETIRRTPAWIRANQ